MSYNFSLVLGLYYKISYPLKSTYDNTYAKHLFNVEAIGYFLSTPVLYLISNIGGVNYFNASDESAKIDASSI